MEEKDQNYMQEITRIGKWCRIFSVMAIIGACLMIIVGLVAIFVGPLYPSYDVYGECCDKVFEDESAIMKDTGILYIAFAALLVPIIIFLLRGASAAKRCIINNDNEKTLLFLKSKNYWKFCGILTIVFLSIFIFDLLLLIVDF